MVTFVVVSVLFFVRPSTDVPRHDAAIVVLNGSGPRLDEGIALAKAGVAPWLVVSTSATSWLCPHPIPGVHIVCFEPHPSTTQGEARFAGALARAHHWHRIVVVASTPQVSRARFRVSRCYQGTIQMVGVVPGGFWSWLYGIVYEWGATAKALVLQPSC